MNAQELNALRESDEDLGKFFTFAKRAGLRLGRGAVYALAALMLATASPADVQPIRLACVVLLLASLKRGLVVADVILGGLFLTLIWPFLVAAVR